MSLSEFRFGLLLALKGQIRDGHTSENVPYMIPCVDFPENLVLLSKSAQQVCLTAVAYYLPCHAACSFTAVANNYSEL